MQSSYSEKEPIKKLSVWIKWTIVATVCVPLSLMLLELGWDLVHRKLSAEFVVGILGSIALCFLQAINLKEMNSRVYRSLGQAYSLAVFLR